MKSSTSHIASLLLTVWAVVWGVNVSHEWFHHQHDHGHGHGGCSQFEQKEDAPVDGVHVQLPSDDSECAVCDWDWAPVRAQSLAGFEPARLQFALRMDFPLVVAGHPCAWLVGIHGRRGPPEAR